MSIRGVFMALTIPLFLLMAAVNGAVLYFQEQSEMSRALNDQALAAAIVTAEFIAEMDDPQTDLSKPQRQMALNTAARHIEGLQGLYLVENSGSITPLINGSVEWTPAAEWTEQSAVPAAYFDETTNAAFFAAIHPAGSGRAVAARIDAAPLSANAAQMTQIIVLIILAVSIFSAALSLLVARHISRELKWNGKALNKPSQELAAEQFKIRETCDLSDAVRLMKASRDAAEMRHRRDSERASLRRDALSAARELQSDLFADTAVKLGLAAAAVRICGEVPLGSFYVLVEEEGGGGHIMIGLCQPGQRQSETANAAANAVANAAAARRFIEVNLTALGLEKCLKLAREAFNIEEIEILSWSPGHVPQDQNTLLCNASAETRRDALKIAASTKGLPPDQVLDAIACLLKPTGIFAAISTGETV